MRVYKQLKMAERAYRTIKDALDVRPIRHHLEDRVEAHFFLFLLAYYLLFELQARLAPMLFTDDTPIAPTDPVAPARRSPAANTKAGRARTTDGLPAFSLTDLIAELGTICRNQLRIGDSPHTFPRLTNHNTIQTKALELSTSNSARSQSQTSPQHPNPAPTRGIRHLTTENFRLTHVGVRILAGECTRGCVEGDRP